MNPTVMQWHTPDNKGIKPCLVESIRGGKLRIIISLDTGVTTMNVNANESRHMRQCLRRGEPYSVKRACIKFLKQRKTVGCTKAARKRLKEIKASL